MTRSGWQNPWVRTVTTLLTAAVMVMIFCFSLANAQTSDTRSGYIAMPVIRLLYPDYKQMNAAAQDEIYAGVSHVVRKCAHFTEYMVLGFLLRLCLESWFGHRMKKYRILALIGFGAGTAYACTDELHQLGVEGRSGAWKDVLVDAGGVLLGVALGTMLVKTLNRKSAE